MHVAEFCVEPVEVAPRCFSPAVKDRGLFLRILTNVLSPVLLLVWTPILTSVRWHSFVVLICISVVSRDVEYFSCVGLFKPPLGIGAPRKTQNDQTKLCCEDCTVQEASEGYDQR